MKIGLFLADLKGEATLRGLVGKVEIGFVVSYPSEGTRFHYFNMINQICLDHNIKFIHRSHFSSHLNDEVDRVFVVGWQYMIRGDLSKYVILHDSKLPLMKGWSPTVSALIEGHRSLHATSFQAVDKMDDGPVFQQAEREIEYPIKISEAFQIVASMYVDLILGFSPVIQPISGIESYSMWRDEEDYRIQWKWDASRIKRFIDAVGFPYKGAKFIANGNEYRVSNGEIVPEQHIVDRNTHLGKVIRFDGQDPVVICGEGLIKLSGIMGDGDHDITKIRTRLQ